MGAPVLPKRVYRFGLFQVDPDSRKLLRRGAPVRIHDQPFDVLCRLLECPGEIVTREELCQLLWPENTYVEFEGSLNAALKKLRFALGDDADNPIFIETVPKRGYRFLAPVECEQASEVTSAAVEEPAIPVLQTTSERSSPGPRFPLWTRWVVAGATVVLSLVGWIYRRGSQLTPPAPARKVIAVLPFSNQGAGPDFDYLRYAIADDLVTDLTYARSVSVRPFASTSRYGSQPSDPETVGKELRVTHIVAGGFLLDKQNLRVSLELVDVAQNQPIWREEITVSPQDLVALHDRLAARTAQGLLPAMNVVGTSLHELPMPKNEQAFELFEHSLAIPLDPESNLLGIKKLEESLSLDSSYAPAWGELGGRHYVDFHFRSQDEAALRKALQEYKRQSELDPETPPVWTIIRVEQGDLNGAYDQAASFLRRRPDSATAHFGIGYVLRYAGLLGEAGQECDAALALDPGYSGLRSCANPFILAREYARAQRYISLDEGYGALMRVRIALRNRDGAAALAGYDAAARIGYKSRYDLRTLLRACMNHAPEAELGQAVATLEADSFAAHDPELLYQNGELLGFCGQGDAALRQLQKAIKGNYCSYPAMDKDPLFDSIRQLPEFAELRQAGIQCQENFLAHREQVRAALQASHQ
jgi:DNA-binding winged helix-turn-helix (wHTH) protein/TolB-like protein